MPKFLQVGVEGGDGVKYRVDIEGGHALVGALKWRGGDCMDICSNLTLPAQWRMYECGSFNFQVKMWCSGRLFCVSHTCGL